MKVLALALLCLTIGVTSAANYAVLVAGSNGFYNYRHQADICHAYHIVINHGIPAENVIVMSYNDVAKSSQNPFPNTLYNKPTGDAPGIDYNKGCVIDYQGSSVTPENFMAILTGDASKVKGGNGKVLKSGPNDNVFLNFADHGGSGLIAFPSKYLYARDLISTFKTMTEKKMYKELTFYLEACESGSMFLNLPKDTKIYALSASNPSESSWGTYCPPDDKVNGKNIGSCLGDLFSVNWMEDTDAADVNTETLQEQFEKVKQKTTRSEVMQWGDLSFTSQTIGTFLGKKQMSRGFLDKLKNTFEDQLSFLMQRMQDSRDIKINYLLAKVNKNLLDSSAYDELQLELAKSQKFAKVFQSFQDQYRISGVYYGSTNFECYATLIDRKEGECGKLNEQSLTQLKYLYQYCGMYTNWQDAEFKHC